MRITDAPHRAIRCRVSSRRCNDNSITQATLALLKERPHVAAIMGGQDETRGSEVYSGVARISAALCRENFLMASGGGPGAMEAAHLGACFRDDAPALESAIAELKNTAPSLPADAGKVIGPNGEIDQEIAQAPHAWIMPAWWLSQTANGPELGAADVVLRPRAVDAIRYADREVFSEQHPRDGLIALAAHGIVFASAKAGTLQEIFQDSVRNYYRGPSDPFSPMVFFGKTYWTEKLPATVLLQALFTNSI